MYRPCRANDVCAWRGTSFLRSRTALEIVALTYFVSSGATGLNRESSARSIASPNVVMVPHLMPKMWNDGLSTEGLKDSDLKV